MPEYIEKFFVEAYRTFGGTITPAKDRKGEWSISRVPPDLRKLPEALERRYGKIGQTYPLITFDKESTFGYSEVEFIGPGHPLFEGVVERVLREYGGSLRQGAVFYNAEATEPTVLWLLKCGVEDGRGQTVGERLVAVHCTEGRFRKSQPYALLDLKSPDSVAEVPAPTREVATGEDAVINWSLEGVTPDYFAEIDERRGRELGIKEKYVRKSLQHLIGESVKKIGKYDQQLRQMRDETDPKRLNLLGNRAQEEAGKRNSRSGSRTGWPRSSRGGTCRRSPPKYSAWRSSFRPPGRSCGRWRGWRTIPRLRPPPSPRPRNTRLARAGSRCQSRRRIAAGT
jgi:hypothetical protein